MYREAASNFGRRSEVVDAYNQLVSTYLGNNATQTKGIILSSIRRTIGFVSEIRGGLVSTIQLYTGVSMRERSKTPYIQNCLYDIVVAVVAFDVIKEH